METPTQRRKRKGATVLDLEDQRREKSRNKDWYNQRQKNMKGPV
jgi:hypothetical protein